MADGYNRFGGQYLYQQHSRSLHRNGSPISNGRGLFQPSADTPSPNRSPGTHSPAHASYGMYNHNSHRQNHGLLNGAGGHAYQNAMSIHKSYQTQNHAHQAHHISNQHQDHASIGGHGAYGNHQHTVSGGALSTPNFTPAHLQNGTPESAGAVSKPKEHWTLQLQEYETIRAAMNKPHFYARNTPNVSRLPTSTLSAANLRNSDGEEHGERRRTINADDMEEAGAWDAMDLGGQGLKSMGASIFRFYPHMRKMYFNHNKLIELPPQIGQLRWLTVLDLSFNNLKRLPPEIGMLTNLKKLLLFDNHLETLPFEIGSLHHLELLGIEGNRNFRQDLKERLIEHGTKDLVEYMREQAPAPPVPLDREWISLVDDADAEAEKFSVLSWNILCDRAATPTVYGYTATHALSWDYRKGAILDELRARKADILALQEIDQESYNEFFRPNLATEDYKGIYWAKARAQTMAEQEAKIVDGCAIFYKNSKYVLLDKQLIIFSREALQRPDMKGEHDVYNRIMPRDHIAVVAFLENRMTGSRLIVVNTHLAWEGWYADVKVVQVAILMERLTKLANTYASWPPCKDKELFKYATEDGPDNTNGPNPEPAPSQQYDSSIQIPLLLCGDFNSTIDSGVYDLITQGSLSNSHSDLGEQTYGDFTKHGMSHPFSLKSSYAAIRDWPFTNYTADFREVIDYIWYSTNTLQVTGLLGEVDPDYMKRVPGFPNWHFPSDHLALWAEFAVKGRKEKRKPVEADFGPSRRESRQ